MRMWQLMTWQLMMWQLHGKWRGRHIMADDMVAAWQPHSSHVALMWQPCGAVVASTWCWCGQIQYQHTYMMMSSHFQPTKIYNHNTYWPTNFNMFFSPLEDYNLNPWISFTKLNRTSITSKKCSSCITKNTKFFFEHITDKFSSSKSFISLLVL
jgi:hypothetical protein